VAIKNLAFIPRVVHTKVGQTIAWANYDTPPHNVTYVSGPGFRSSPPTMNLGAKYSITLTKAGTIHYYCTIHPWMTGTIVISP
jgi:amicyanin